MQRSIAARYAARPAARFVDPAAPGPRAAARPALATSGFRAAAGPPDRAPAAGRSGPVALLRSDWRAGHAGPTAPTGRPGSPARVPPFAGRSSAPRAAGRRPRAAAAPWRA